MYNEKVDESHFKPDTERRALTALERQDFFMTLPKWVQEHYYKNAFIYHVFTGVCKGYFSRDRFFEILAGHLINQCKSYEDRFMEQHMMTLFPGRHPSHICPKCGEVSNG